VVFPVGVPTWCKYGGDWLLPVERKYSILVYEILHPRDPLSPVNAGVYLKLSVFG
jgi:hypothetical protein